MAERSRRTGSRRTTPQPTIERKSRATRSQSHDISDIEERSRTDRRHRGNSHASKSTTVAAAAKTRELKASTEHDLSTVTEEPRDAQEKHQPSRRSEVNEQDTNAGPLNAERKSLGGASAFSGTTARTSNSAQELDDLKSESLMDALSSIMPETESLLELLVSGERWDVPDNQLQIRRLCEELGTKNSRTQKKFKRVSQKFQIPWEEFDADFFIDIGTILSALFGIHVSQKTAQEPWRPDPLLQKTNIASFALALHTSRDLSDDVELWTSIDREFPYPFLSENDTLDAEARRLTLELAIEIRTQYIIRLVAQEGQSRGSNILGTVDQVFREARSLKGWNFEGLRTQQLDETMETAIQERIRAIKKVIKQADKTDSRNSVIVVNLKDLYPWIQFLGTATQWLRTRVVEIDYYLEVYGGSGKILDALEVEIKKTRPDRPLPERASHQEKTSLGDTSAESPDHGQVDRAPALGKSDSSTKKTRAKELKSVAFNPQSPKSKALAAELFARTNSANRSINSSATTTQGESHKKPSAKTSHQTQPTQQRSGSFIADERLDAPQAQDQESLDDDEDSEQISPDVIQEIVQTSASQQAESNKENELHGNFEQGRRPVFLYNHPQADARRETWPEGDIENVPLQDVTTHQNGRRSEGHNETRKRPSPEIEEAHHSPVKRARHAGSQRQRERDRVASTAPPGLAEVTAGEIYREANLAAKARVASRGKPAQSRVPWSEEESGRLIDLIQDHGCGWSLLKELDKSHPDGPLLTNRDQVALKDKANNMKVDFLKAARNLPHPNWDHVSLRSNMVAKLRDLGIPYDRETGRREDADLY